MKRIKSEFYDNFHETPIEIVNAGIIASKSLMLVERYFAEDSDKLPTNKITEKILSNVNYAINNGDIYKKSIFFYFPCNSKLAVLKAICKLSDNATKNLFKFCSIEEKSELVEDLRDNYSNDFSLFRCTINKLNDILEGRIKLVSFYSMFSMNTKEEILICMELLSNYEKYLVFKKFGYNLLGNGLYMTPEENRIIDTNIYLKMKRYLHLLKNGYQVLGLTDIYSNLTLEQIKEYVELLTEKRKDYFYRIFGENLDKKRLVPNKEKLLDKDYRKALNRIINYREDKHIDRKLKPFFTIFESLKKEEETLEDFKKRVANIVPTLSPRAIKTTKHLYGENYEETIAPEDATREEIKYFSSNVVPFIKKKIRKENERAARREVKVFYSRFPLFKVINYNEDLFFSYVLYELSLLNDTDISLLIKRFGENLDEVHAVSEEEIIKIKVIIAKIRRKVYLKLSKCLGVRVKQFVKIGQIYYSPIINEIDTNLDKNIIVAVLSYLYIDKILVEEIEKVLGVNPLSYLETVKKLLEEKDISRKTLKI